MRKREHAHAFPPARWCCLFVRHVVYGVTICLLVPNCVFMQNYDPMYVFREQDEPTSEFIDMDDMWTKTRSSDSHFVDLDVNTESQCRCREHLDRKYSSCINCNTFPRDVHFTYISLSISNTTIVNLHSGDLVYRNWHLKSLLLQDNHRLECIEPGAFAGMEVLRNLSICNNERLKHLHRDSFMGLINLDVLFVIANSFVRFSDVTWALHPQSVPLLRKIKLQNFKATNVTQTDFDSLMGVPIEILSVKSCNIKYIDPDILIPLMILQDISLDKNDLNVDNLIALIRKIVQLKRPLNQLSMSNIGLQNISTHLMEEIEQSIITHLTLSNNHFGRIEKFPRLTKIEHLDLKGVSATKIKLNAFAQMPSLRTLFLDDNQFNTVPPAVNLTTLLNLDMSSNSRYAFILPIKTFLNMNYLTYLNLSNNNLQDLRNHSFEGLVNLRVLDLENSQINTAESGTFDPFGKLEYLNLKNNPFLSYHMNPDLFSGLTNLKVLLLSYCSIESISQRDNIFTQMHHLQHLVLDHNHFIALAPYLFQNLTELISLDISHNKIHSWDNRLFPSRNKLQKVIAMHNFIWLLSPAMIEDFNNLTTLDVRENAFDCNCEWRKRTMDVTTAKVVRLITDHPPRCFSPNEWTDNTIVEFLTNESIVEKYCQKLLYPDNISVIFIVAPLVLLAVVLCSAIIVAYVFRWHLRYWMFLLRLGFSGSTTSFVSKKTYRYDAFVSYCSEDRDFVIRMIAMLEHCDRPLKLCVYERDFQIGTVISESVLESVADSRRTLLVISDAYIKSQWCRWEAQVAENHRLFFENEYGHCVNDTLVMVKLGDISQSRISPMLCYLMKTRIYLQWDPAEEQEFWKKLRKSLRPSRRLVKHSLF